MRSDRRQQCSFQGRQGLIADIARRFSIRFSFLFVGFFLAFSFAFSFQAGHVVASDPSAGAILGNPMEKYFEESGTNQGIPLREPVSKRAQFADSSLASTNEKPLKKGSSDRIRQVSGSDSAPSVWDNPTPAVSSGTSIADWGVGPNLVAPNVSSPSPATMASNFNLGPQSSFGEPSFTISGNGLPQGNYSQGFGFGWMRNETPSSGENTPQVPNTNPYSNTDPNSFATPSWNPYANFGSISPYANGTTGMYGFGYYDPSTGQIHSNPYGNVNPYGNDGSYGFSNPYGNSYGANPYQPVNPYGSVPGWSGMNDPFAATMGQSSSASPYQLLLQQELYRRQKEGYFDDDEDEEKKKGGKSEDEWTMKRLMPVHVTSPLGETLVSGLKTMSPFNTPTGPDRGVGQPLMGRSWLDRPYYFGGFVGTIYGSDLVSGMIDQDHGGHGGLIFGYNMSEYWGLESRFHFSSIDIHDTDQAVASFQNWYRSMYPDDPFVPTLSSRSNQLTTFDVSVHYYPLGNSKWRPFFKYGLGVTREKFIDSYGQKQTLDAISMPIGGGLRYWWNERFAIQLDLVDNIVFSSGTTKTQNNFAFAVGFTYSFGTSKKCRPSVYWPYMPSNGSKW